MTRKQVRFYEQEEGMAREFCKREKIYSYVFGDFVNKDQIQEIVLKKNVKVVYLGIIWGKQKSKLFYAKLETFY